MKFKNEKAVVYSLTHDIPMKKLLYISFILLFLISCNAQETTYKNYRHSLSELISSNHADASAISILIDKSEYKLSVRIDSLVLKEYPVVFGKKENNDKLMQGDKCTPEGHFKMISKYPHKSWSKFIWLNYPNDESREKHNAAILSGKIPKDADIGGEVGIHGVPLGMDYLIDAGYNWTLGCISMKNRDVDEIYPYISKSTSIEIRK
jgi:murein L,D-transpeptidase YafK